MISGVEFYALAIPAVLILGIAKGGLGGGIGMVAVPMIAIVVSPATAAAIVLPVLLVMDVLAVRAYWRQWSWPDLAVLLPGGLLGTIAGWVTFHWFTTAGLRLLVGAIAVGYAGLYFMRQLRAPLTSGNTATANITADKTSTQPVRGVLWGILGGFTSFSIHAGGPPVQAHLLSRQLDRTTFQATNVAFFFVINWLKFGPYLHLGQFDRENVLTALVLMPLAPVGIATGAWLHRRINDGFFFLVVHVGLLLLGCKLIYDGMAI